MLNFTRTSPKNIHTGRIQNNTKVINWNSSTCSKALKWKVTQVFSFLLVFSPMVFTYDGCPELLLPSKIGNSEKKEKIAFDDSFGVTKCLQQIEMPDLLHRCASCSERASNVSTMGVLPDSWRGEDMRYPWNIKLSTFICTISCFVWIVRGVGKPHKKLFFFSGPATKASSFLRASKKGIFSKWPL